MIQKSKKIHVKIARVLAVFDVNLVESIAKFLLIFSWNNNSSSKVNWESVTKDTFNKDSQCLKINFYFKYFKKKILP